MRNISACDFSFSNNDNLGRELEYIILMKDAAKKSIGLPFPETYGDASFVQYWK